jgi:hypothetical protein
MIRVTEDNLEELSKQVEVLEVLDEGVKILTTKNGVVMHESVAKWDDVVLFGDNGSIAVLTKKEYFAVQGDEIINIQVNLPEGLDKVIEATPKEELSVMTDAAMEKVVSTMEKTKKPRVKKTKKAE